VFIPAGTMVEHEEARVINDQKITRLVVRSPLGCRNLGGICQSCYGFDLGNNAPAEIGAAVGIVAAQAIGEPGTQLTMRTFHTGGVAGGGDITTGLPRVEEIFEVRLPKASALISEAAGEIIEIVNSNGEKIIKILPDPQESSSGHDTKKYPGSSGMLEMRAPDFSGIMVEEGSPVEKGDLLSEGHADISQLFKIAGRERTERYIIKEVQKIYSLQGAPIHDKHIEVVVRQMFSRVRIKDAGDTGFTPGDVIEKREFGEVNSKTIKRGMRPARAVQILMGITKVALTTTSFLSAASFQETARVLIDAAVRGKRDELRGLKENVIIGRLIPAGTGFRKK
jgi:DNA-directed RNA polymerase subunit beta'